MMPRRVLRTYSFTRIKQIGKTPNKFLVFRNMSKRETGTLKSQSIYDISHKI